jgi:hypothetical protein
MFIEKVFAAGEEVSTSDLVNKLNDAFSFAGGISNLLNFGLMIGGAIALGTIIFGGITYSMSGDDSSKQKNAKEWIWAAVKGLAVIAFGFILLRLLNPGSFN